MQNVIDLQRSTKRIEHFAVVDRLEQVAHVRLERGRRARVDEVDLKGDTGCFSYCAQLHTRCMLADGMKVLRLEYTVHKSMYVRKIRAFSCEIKTRIGFRVFSRIKLT